MPEDPVKDIIAPTKAFVTLDIKFDNGEEKSFVMTLEAYWALKQGINSMRRPGSEATIQIGIASGEFILPWAKVMYAVAELKGSPNPAEVLALPKSIENEPAR